MGLRFRKSVKLGPLRINFSKSGVGYSVGGKGYRVTKRADGKTQTTASIPGTGIAYPNVSGSATKGNPSGGSTPPGKSSGGSGERFELKFGHVLLIVFVLLMMASCMANTSDQKKQAAEQAAAAETTKQETTKQETTKQSTAATKPAATEKPAAAADKPVDEEKPTAPAKEPEKAPQEAAEKPSQPAKADTPAQPAKSDTAATQKPAKATPAKETPAPKPEPEPVAVSVIGNKNSKVYHELGCSSIDAMKESNKVTFQSADKAKASGYKPCSRCH